VQVLDDFDAARRIVRAEFDRHPPVVFVALRGAGNPLA
jgi:hypothetical protein